MGRRRLQYWQEQALTAAANGDEQGAANGERFVREYRGFLALVVTDVGREGGVDGSVNASLGESVACGHSSEQQASIRETSRCTVYFPES
jgi:hypothetical protein